MATLDRGRPLFRRSATAHGTSQVIGRKGGVVGKLWSVGAESALSERPSARSAQGMVSPVEVGKTPYVMRFVPVSGDQATAQVDSPAQTQARRVLDRRNAFARRSDTPRERTRPASVPLRANSRREANTIAWTSTTQPATADSQVIRSATASGVDRRTDLRYCRSRRLDTLLCMRWIRRSRSLRARTAAGSCCDSR
jgi:hypothetical protein